MKLSVIVPIYNCERYVASCIDSVLRMKTIAWELLLVIDGSSDGSEAICRSYEQTDQRIRVLTQENRGPAAARNLALKEAVGEYIRFIDADDELTDVDFSTQPFTEDMMVMNADVLDEHRNKLGVVDVAAQGHKTVKELLETMNPDTKPAYLHYIWNKLYRREIIRKNGLRFDEQWRQGEDFIFNCAYLRCCESVYLRRECSYSYFKRKQNSLTNQFRPNELERRRTMDSVLFALYDAVFPNDVRPLRRAQGMVGGMAIVSMRTVLLPDCKLNPQQKIAYLRSFLYSEYRRYILQYGKLAGRLPCGMRVQILCARLRAPLLLWVFYALTA